MISCNNFSRSRHRRCARINCSKRTAADISAALCDLSRLIFRVYVWTVNGLTERGKTPRKTNDRRARNESSAGSWHYRRRLIHRRPIVITVDGRQIGWRKKAFTRHFRVQDERSHGASMKSWRWELNRWEKEARKRETQKKPGFPYGVPHDNSEFHSRTTLRGRNNSGHHMNAVWKR